MVTWLSQTRTLGGLRFPSFSYFFFSFLLLFIFSLNLFLLLVSEKILSVGEKVNNFIFEYFLKLSV